MKKFLIVSLIYFFNLSFFTNSAYSELYIYPDSRNPIFYVDFPNAWNTMAEDELIYSSLDNDSVFIFLWSIDAKDTSEAVTSVEGILSSIFDALEIQRHNDVFINDILFKNFEGKGEFEESPMDFSLYVFTPDEEINFMLLYFGSPDMKQKYVNIFNYVLYSIRKA